MVILDRFPLPQIQLMDGAQARDFVQQLNIGPRANLFLTPRPNSWLAKLLVKMEEDYYSQMVLPEVLAVLKVNPAIAVQRKTTEDASSVEKRSTEIWQINWEDTTAYVVDASNAREEVASELKRLIWSRL